MTTSRCEGKAARILPDSCVTFLLDRQGDSGEGWTGGGTEIPGRQGQDGGKELNTTQRNATQADHIKAQHNRVYIHVEATRHNSTLGNIYPLGYIILYLPRLFSVPPATCHLAVPRFRLVLACPALLCSCSLGTYPSYLPAYPVSETWGSFFLPCRLLSASSLFLLKQLV